MRNKSLPSVKDSQDSKDSYLNPRVCLGQLNTQIQGDGLKHSLKSHQSLSTPDTITIVIRSEGKHVAPLAVRLRRALKLMLRAFGLRVISVSTTAASAARGLP